MTADEQKSQEDAGTSLADRGEQRSRRPHSKDFLALMRTGWAERASQLPHVGRAASFAAARRERLSSHFPGVRLVIPAGGLVRRSNDTDYRFRPHSAFAHLTGLGTDQEPDAVLVLDPEPGGGHRAVLFLRPPSGRDSDEFFASARYGEFWVGPRPGLDELGAITGIEARDIAGLADALAKDVGAQGVALAIVQSADAELEAACEAIRLAAGLAEDDASRDAKLTEAVSELRLVKDEYEVEQLRLAIAATAEGFENVLAALPGALDHARGERVVESAFDSLARVTGNAVGYETIAAAGEHATILHWIRNDGVVSPGDLLLLDAGVEVDSLYTADITRTIPVSGAYSEVQRRVYEAVLDAADAAFAAAKPGNRFRDVHAAAMAVIAERLHEWGLLPVPPEVALSESGGQHRRWMVHGTSHHLGLDVHDCAQARQSLYLDAVLEPGMVFTIEPGLYFKADDLLVPQEYRGIGVRIEDDVLITEDGNENLSAALPRRPDDVEAWVQARLRRRAADE
ncbi:aminopeptidase P family protein [Rarobacter faecitabidus]|uniref:Xaa-Pro aminopeptidase n=1 Tax=Rarobacter faecitabidus TaxID=13243 RepID=A0A542ZXP2_RARFA|nr:aminopeptidase P family protein [Rarobacter faecitabidus]TQL64980.1 Xaa-Pro aminopeptidase [Rarobacter faecitabidus]